MRLLFILLFISINLYANIEEFENYIQKEVEKESPPSASFAILEGNKVVYVKSFGYNDANLSQQTNVKSVYHVYSLTKILTATIVMKLIEENKIKLDDSIKRYFPNFNVNFNNKSADVTILQLLNHSSGINDRSPNLKYMMENKIRDISLELPYMPGSEAKYSSAEYIILGKVIEQVTGKTFEQVARQYILNPAKMSRSNFHYDKTMASNQVYGTIQFFSITGAIMKFILDDKNKDFYKGSTLWLKEFDIGWQAAGGLVSSIDDMAKFLSAYNANKLFSKKTKNIFTASKKVKVNSWLTSQDDVGFGIGWYHIFDKGKFFYQHQGLGPGFRTIMRIYPAYDISIIILTSQTSVDIDMWSDKLIDSIIQTSTDELNLY